MLNSKPKSTLPSTLQSTWFSIEAWLKHRLPAMHATLRAGNPDAENRDLPSELLELYTYCNGQDHDQGGLFFGWYLLSADDAVAAGAIWQQLLIGDPAINQNVFSTSHPDGAIQNAYISNDWIPFAHDGGGNHLGIDLEPGLNGVRGQVINFGRDQTDKYVLALSLEEFLGEFLACLMRGDTVIQSREIMNQMISTLSLHPKADSPVTLSWRTVFT